MNIIIFGATGSIGRILTEQAVVAGHQVTAFTRNAASVQQNNKTLNVIEGTVRSKDDVLRAIDGHDAVICTLGAGREGTLRSEGTQNIVAAMTTLGVRRFICQSTLGAGDSSGTLNFFWKYIMFGMLLRAAFADHERQEAIVQASDLDWTLVRPGAFTNGPLTRMYRSGFPGTEKNLRLKISRADVAHFLLKVLNENTHHQQAVNVSN